MELVVLTHNSPSFSPCCISRSFFKSISSLTCTPPSWSHIYSSSSSSFICKMEPNKAQGKRSLDFKIEEEEEDDEDEDRTSRPSVLVLHGEDDRRKRVMVMNGTSATSPSKKAVSGAGGSTTTRPSCQAQSCNADLSDVKQYCRRHKVCDFHSKAPVVVVGGLQQRFCQQCSRFHSLSEFDENKRSCRRRLAGHNERRRKSSTDYPN